MMLSTLTVFKRDEVSVLRRFFGMMDDRLKNERLKRQKYLKNLVRTTQFLELTEISVHHDCLFITRLTNSMSNRPGLFIWMVCP